MPSSGVTVRLPLLLLGQSGKSLGVKVAVMSGQMIAHGSSQCLDSYLNPSHSSRYRSHLNFYQNRTIFKTDYIGR